MGAWTLTAVGQNATRVHTRQTAYGGVPVIELIGHADGPRVLISAGVHGDEYEPVRAVCRLCDMLQSVEIAGCITLIPVANPSAFATRDRCGEDGRDMARTFPGSATGSATERAAADVTEIIGISDVFIDLHTGGAAFDIEPFTGYMLVHDPNVLEKQRNMARAFGLPVVWGTTPELDGRSLSIARDAGVPAIYAEFGGGGGCREEIVEAYVNGCARVLAHFGVVAGSKASMAVEHWIEDNRPDSGHLQLCHPSPTEGFFESVVQVGDRVAAGDPLGVVMNLVTGEKSNIVAEHGGIVLVLRKCPAVRKDDALVVVLDVDDVERRRS